MRRRWEVVRQTIDKPDKQVCTHRSAVAAEVCRGRYERRDRRLDRVTGFHYTDRLIAPSPAAAPAVEGVTPGLGTAATSPATVPDPTPGSES